MKTASAKKQPSRKEKLKAFLKAQFLDWRQWQKRKQSEEGQNLTFGQKWDKAGQMVKERRKNSRLSSTFSTLRLLNILFIIFFVVIGGLGFLGVELSPILPDDINQFLNEIAGRKEKEG